MAQSDNKSRPQNDYTLVPTGPDEDNMEVDDMLALAGDFGRLQYLMMIMFSIVNIFCAFHYFAQTYISIVPDFWCKGSNYLQCQDNENATTCEAGWDYNLTGGFKTVISELNWVCDNSWYASWGQAPYFVGSVFGTLILGFVADWKGRIPVLVISYVFAFIGNFVTAFSYHLPQFMLGRALAGIATDSNFFMMYIIVMEYMRPDMRTFGLNLCIGVFYCIGCVVSPWLALFSGDWRYFLFGISAPMLVVPVLAILLPESAGWLINKGRVEDAVLRFNRIAKINGREPLSQSAIDRFKATAEKRIPVQTTSSGIFSLVKLFGLVKTPRLRKHTILLVIKTMALCLVYDAISRNVDGTEFNPFILSSISSLTIFPSCLVILFLQDKVGRKAMASVSLLLSGLFIGTEGVIQATMGDNIDSYTTVVLDIIGRFAVNIAYNSGTQYAAELIPTEVRGQGVAFIHVVGYIATTASPFLLTLKWYWNAIPGLIMGSLAIAGAACCLHLPETMDKTLPLTLEDGENFGEGEGMWDFACFKKKSKVLTVE